MNKEHAIEIDSAPAGVASVTALDRTHGLATIPAGYANRKARRRWEATKKRADFKQKRELFRMVQKRFGLDAAMALVTGAPRPNLKEAQPQPLVIKTEEHMCSSMSDGTEVG